MKRPDYTFCVEIDCPKLVDCKNCTLKAIISKYKTNY